MRTGIVLDWLPVTRNTKTSNANLRCNRPLSSRRSRWTATVTAGCPLQTERRAGPDLAAGVCIASYRVRAITCRRKRLLRLSMRLWRWWRPRRKRRFDADFHEGPGIDETFSNGQCTRRSKTHHAHRPFYNTAHDPPVKIGPCPPGANAGNTSACGALAPPCGRGVDGDAGSRSVTALSDVIGTLGFASSSVFLIEPADVPK